MKTGQSILVVALVLFTVLHSSAGTIYVRLANGDDAASGRVEVRNSTTAAWGTICDDDWGNKDATVVCRMLGHKWGEEVYTSRFGAGSGPIYMDNVRCVGNETSLENCLFNGWGVHNCYHYLDAGVVCSNTTFRLVGTGSSSNAMTSWGAVEYRDETGWKPVCDNFWDDLDAKVACVGLGQGFVDGRALCCSSLSPYTYNPYLYNFRSRTNYTCTGNEANIFACPNKFQNTGCPYRKIASVICYTRPKSQISTDFTVTIQNGTDRQGIVKVTRWGLVGKVCASNWNDKGANVVCRQNNFMGGVMYGEMRYKLNQPAWITSINCTGSESRLQQCVSSAYGAPKYSCYGDSVLCYQTSAPTISLAGGGPTYGRVTITVDGVSGTICDNGWSSSEARTVCQQLGFKDGTALKGSYYGPGTGQPVYMDRVSCYSYSGHKKIWGCDNNGWQNVAAACNNHTKDASVSCFNEVRLAKGDHSHGIVQVWDLITTSFFGFTYSYYGWKPVCGTGFTNTDATVVCKELGFQKGRTLPFGSYGRQYGTYYGRNITCTGSEPSIVNCTTSSGTCSSRSNTGYAAVVCYNGTLSTNTSVGLVGGLPQFASFTGRVAVTKMGIRGRICGSNWDDNDANVLCKQLGYPGGVSYTYSSSGFGPYLISEINCAGNESSIFNCPMGPEACGSYSYYSRDAGVLCYKTTPIRLELVGGTQMSGRAEIIYEGQRGTICNYYSTADEAKAICRQAGFNDGIIDKSFGPGTGPVFMANPYCFGQETSIFQCSNHGWRSGITASCQNHKRDIGVRCFKNVKLTGGSMNANVSIGEVEVFVESRWRSVCKPGFDDKGATVICRELGFGYGVSLPPIFSSYTPATTQSVTALNCTGSETSIKSCPYTVGSCTRIGFSNSNFATVACQKNPITNDFTVTIGTTFPSLVTIQKFGVSASICMDGWDDREAMVLCKSKGYNNGIALGSVGYNYNAPPRVLSNFMCRGNETRLQNCQFDLKPSQKCQTSSNTAAYVYCYNSMINQPSVRLMLNNQPSSTRGRVEVKIAGQWGTICDYSFSDSDARVVCRQLGFNDGVARARNYTTGGSGPAWLDAPKCTGSERAIWNCKMSSFNDTTRYCLAHTRDAHALCTGRIRLQPNSTYGAVQVWQGGSNYKLVCWDNFTDVDAQIACNEQGFVYGVRVGKSAFGYMKYDIGYTNVQCTGRETGFLECPSSTSLTYCPSRDYASVACSNTNPNTGYKMTIENGDHGRVQIRHMGINGYICPNGFDNNEAKVICREKGFTNGFAYTYGSYYFGWWAPIKTMRWLSNIQCDGTETYLSNCAGMRYGDTAQCSMYGDAAVYCYRNTGLQVRLGNKTNDAGRVELAIDGVWGTMCTYYGGYYADNNAAVICRMLKYNGGRHMGIGTFGPGMGPIYLSRLYCKGSETSLTQCGSLWRQSYSVCSSHQKDNAIKCYDTLRVVGAKGLNYGRVEVFKNSQWAPVCDTNFNDNAAKVACRKLGYMDGRYQCCDAVGPMPAANITVTINGCQGTETDLFHCNVATGTTCPSGKYASVYCSATTITAQPPIVRIQGVNDHGTLMMNRYGFWGPICDVGWDNNDANVACKSMGYNGGVKYRGRDYRRSPMVVGRFKCLGTESNITQCTFSDLSNNRQDLGCSYKVSYSRPSAGVLCYANANGLNMRLVGGTNYGRVEFQYDGRWGKVCDYNWDDNDAVVACRQMGFMDGRARYAPKGTNSKTWMTYVYCKGTEKSLFECSNSWSARFSYCYKAAGVVCYNKVRVYEGNQVSTGLLEVKLGNNWGGVCATGWTPTDTALACRQLGYSNGYFACCNAYGRHLGAVMTNVACKSTDTDLTQCSHSVPHNRLCDNVAVACYNGTTSTDFSWQLASGNNYTGEVAVTFINITGRICPDGWTDTSAMVACKELGYSKGQAYTHFRYTFLSNSGPFWTSNVKCKGTETKLADCPRTQLGMVSTCSTTHSAGVLCGDNAGIYFRLAGGSDNAGRVEVSVNGVWGSVCRYSFGSQEATSLCRSLGYNVGVVNYQKTYPGASGPVYQSLFACRGTENSIAACPHTGLKVSTLSYCANHTRDVAVTCLGNVKLASGFAPGIKQGPVQVYQNGTWHYVCDTNFDDVTARTVCRSLGFDDGKALCCSAYGSKIVRYWWYGNGPGTILANMTMRCDGSQTDPMQCLSPGTCSKNYASVVCFNATDLQSETYSFGFDTATAKSGQVAVTHYGYKGRICSTFWSDSEAGVFCKSQGFSNGISYHYNVQYNYQPISSRGPFWMSAVNCTGSETSLANCAFSDRMSLGNCSNANIASAICFNGPRTIQYRMVAPGNITTKNYGRVEMAVGGVWGTVCDRYFDDREAGVFCRQMGYKSGYSFPGAYYGQGSGPIWLSGLQCTGSESSLHQCSHNGFNGEVVDGSGYFSCSSHSDDVSVYCVDTVRFNTGMRAGMGAVEVYANNKWNAVCDTGFNNDAARVVCRTFGYPFGASLKNSVFGRAQPIGVSKVGCGGTENTFKRCSVTASTTCTSGTYASAICSNQSFVDNGFNVRIISDDPKSNAHGYLEVKMKGIWGSVCGTGFSDQVASVACKQLNFMGGVAYTPAVYNPYNRQKQVIVSESRPILMTELKCAGNEASLDKCSWKPKSANTWCDYYAPRAGILCNTNGSIQYRLAGDTTPNQGRLEMKYNGQWGTMCDPYSFANAAKVACKTVGQKDGLPVSSSRYKLPDDKRPVYFTYLRCFGNESTIPTCGHDGFASSNSPFQFWWRYSCQRNGPLSVKCYQQQIQLTKIRLVNGPTNNTGRVEVFLKGPNQWGTVCDDLWDDKDATVACRMLGWGTGKALNRAQFGMGSGPIWLDNVGCKGTEYSLQNCPSNGFAQHNCRHSEDAGVLCSGVPPPMTSTTPTSGATGTGSGTGTGNVRTTTYNPGSTQKLTGSSGPNPAAIAVPIVLIVALAAAAAVFIFYRRRQQKADTEGLVPDIPASGRGGMGVQFTSKGAAFSKGVENIAYDSGMTAMHHVDDTH